MGCDSGKETTGVIPDEFVGQWVFDGDAAELGIRAMEISAGEKAELQSTFVDVARGSKMSVAKDGRVVFDRGFPADLIRLSVVEVRDDEVVFMTTNSANKGSTQYTLNRIENGLWLSRLLDESFKVVEVVPGDYWRPVIVGRELR